jgi:hypothetical protein
MPIRRLTHTSKKSFKRYMQMSRAKIFVFVEGQTDRYFYDEICKNVLIPVGIDYEICLSQEIPKNTPGKTGLLAFFKHLKRVSSLEDDFKGKKTISVFYLDKDIDEILGKSKESDHLIYTKYYNLENYFFIYGDLVQATAAAVALDTASVQHRLGSNNVWRRRVAENWKDWVKLCVYSKKHNINYDCNYGVHSRINNPYDPVDALTYNHRLAMLEIRTGMTPVGFRRSFNCISRKVDNLYDVNQFDIVFKGKWYAVFLIEDVKIIAAGRAYESQSLADKVKSCLQLTIDFSDNWAEHLKEPLALLANKF